MARSFASALEATRLPVRLGDVQLQYERHLWVGRALRPRRGPLANAALIVGAVFGVVTLAALVTGADHGTLGLFVAPTVLAFGAAAWLEQRERRQRAFAADFHEHLLRLDFSTAISGMPRTLKLPFDSVRDLKLEEQGGGFKLLTVDFEVDGRLFREVLVAHVTPKQVEDAERVRKMLRAAVGLEKPAEPISDGPPSPPLPVDTFG